jgi:hypothetical protein
MAQSGGNGDCRGGLYQLPAGAQESRGKKTGQPISFARIRDRLEGLNEPEAAVATPFHTKTDWEVWTAALADSREGFGALMEPVYDFVSATPQRVPLTDWYWTQNAERRGFQARPVIGGVFLPLLTYPEIWKKWAERGRSRGKAYGAGAAAPSADPGDRHAHGAWERSVLVSFPDPPLTVAHIPLAMLSSPPLTDE